MTGPAPKQDPAGLGLRARSRPVTRLSRRVLVGLAALAAVTIAGALWYALDGGGLFRRGPGSDQFSTDHKPEAEGLAGLPLRLGRPSRLSKETCKIRHPNLA